MKKYAKISIIILSFLLTLIPACKKEGSAGPGKLDHSTASWPIFRGNSGLTGTAAALPDSLHLIWTFKTASYIVSSPVIGMGSLFIGSSDGKVYALNLSDGSQVWAYDCGDDIEASPLLLEGRIFIGSLSGDFFCLDAGTGNLIWKIRIDNSIYGSANWAVQPGSGKTVLFVGSYDNRLYALDPQTGKTVWHYETDNYINGAPSTDGKVIVFGGCDEILHILSVSDGTKQGEVWAGSYIPGSAALTENHAYLGHYDNKLVCIDISAKKIVWEYQNRESGDAFFASPAVDKSHVVIGSRDRLLHCVDRLSGAKIWTFRTLDEIDSSPVIAADKVVVASTDGRLYLVRLSDGQKIWSYEIGAALIGSPAVTAGCIFIGGEDGVVYAFGGK